MYLTQNGTLLQWLSQSVQAINSTQAEAMAVLEGARMLREMTGGEGIILSDSMDIVNSVRSILPNVTDWRAFSEIWRIWEIIVASQGKCQVKHCNREEEMLQLAHRLANQGRLYAWNRRGCNEAVFNIDLM